MHLLPGAAAEIQAVAFLIIGALLLWGTVAAWVIGTRNTMRALLLALLEPIAQLRQLEVSGDYTRRLALLEELKGLPSGAVWGFFCLQQGVPVGTSFMDEIEVYEKQELSKRG